MEQRDYLLRQAELFGQVLGKLLAKLLNIKNQEQTSSALEITNQAFSEDLGLDIDALIALDTNDLIHLLIAENKFSNENFERLADIFFIIAENSSLEERNQLHKKCLAMYETIEVSDPTYSINRQFKIEQIKNE
ncbi:hypothetical protein FACS189426_02150 [Bacteroidia bacterium]|nr:hypothetical protein FACS189426_02150 [Bacteroidia bacterium]GHV71752.1 hypothetical protein FACS189420_7850 [Bacteroidia bacterium]